MFKGPHSKTQIKNKYEKNTTQHYILIHLKCFYLFNFYAIKKLTRWNLL